jgi:hypothetical protein
MLVASGIVVLFINNAFPIGKHTFGKSKFTIGSGLTTIDIVLGTLVHPLFVTTSNVALYDLNTA